MRIASIGLVRNEADIIEAFVRHNRQFVDRFYIINDGSKDSTSTILRLLHAEGIDLKVVTEAGKLFQQGARTTELLRAAVAEEAWDFVLPLDADEFVTAPDRSTFEADLAAIPDGAVGAFAERRYLPTDQDDPTMVEPLLRLQHMEDTWPHPFKIIVPSAMVKLGVISDGNHVFYLNGAWATRHVLPNSRLSHFPIRSADHLIAKSLVQYMRTRSLPGYVEGSMTHHHMNLVKSLNAEPRLFVGNDEALQLISSTQYDRSRLIRRPFFWSHGSVKYGHMAAQRPYEQIIGAIDDIIAELQRVRRQDL